MPFCPKCKMEYREGFTVCADCKVPLVDTLEKIPTYDQNDENNIFIMNEEEVEEEIDIPESMKAYAKEDEDGVVRVDEDELIKAINSGEFTTLGDIDEHMLRRIAPQIQGVLRRQRALSQADVYVPSKEKVSDLSSSMITLFLCGGVGLIVVILALVGVIPLPLSGVRLYVVCGAMGLMFVAFIIGGISSYISKKNLSAAISEEEDITKKLIFYIENNFDANEIDNLIDPGIDDGQKYFVRMAYLKKTLSTQFPECSDGFIDNFIDENFDKIFS